jgi:hypothetical protein
MGRKNKVDPIAASNMYHGMLQGGSGAQFQQFAQSITAQQLLRISLNRFRWSGLPHGVPSGLLEYNMQMNGSIALHKPESVDRPIITTWIGQGRKNSVALWNSYRLWSLNRANSWEVRAGDAAIFDPYMTRTNVLGVISYYCEFFREIDKTFKSNLAVQKTPVVIMTSQEKMLTMQNFQSQVNEGAPTIYSYADNAVMGDIQALNYNVTYIGSQLLVDRRQLWNDCMTLLGIDNSNQDKKERLVEDEVSGNNEQVVMNRMVDLKPRREFANRINKLYGMNVTVNWNRDIETNKYNLANDPLFTEDDSIDKAGSA